jgi:hypothetical protein
VFGFAGLRVLVDEGSSLCHERGPGGRESDGVSDGESVGPRGGFLRVLGCTCQHEKERHGWHACDVGTCPCVGHWDAGASAQDVEVESEDEEEEAPPAGFLDLLGCSCEHEKGFHGWDGCRVAACDCTGRWEG